MKCFNKAVKKAILCLTLGFTTLGCKSQINILSSQQQIEPTHNIINPQLREIIDFMLADDKFKNWKKDEKKWLIVSAIKRDSDTIVRLIPRLQVLYSIPKKLPINYKAYTIYKDVLVLYWGDTKLFFKETGIKKNAKLLDVRPVPKIEKNEDDGIEILDLTTYEYYGSEFLIQNNEVRLIETNYFGKPIVE